ncbi:unnamed protein product [Moneuplotes crassus]|uniref:Uncharacterized protein n=1 Tax=Euplotes crassus TaxID=5936 RepID=A0AAD1XZN8_EUPCR|nr:unnamed protein product [Moneuplotes crassus]
MKLATDQIFNLNLFSWNNVTRLLLICSLFYNRDTLQCLSLLRVIIILEKADRVFSINLHFKLNINSWLKCGHSSTWFRNRGREKNNLLRDILFCSFHPSR